MMKAAAQRFIAEAHQHTVIQRGKRCTTIVPKDGSAYPRLLLKWCDDEDDAKTEFLLARHMGKWDIGPKVYLRDGAAFVMEKMDMSLDDYINDANPLTWADVDNLSDQLTGLFRKLILALPGFVFCDLKPENAVIDVDGKRVRLIDFDQAFANKTTDQTNGVLKTMQIVFALNAWFLYPHIRHVVFFKDVVAAEGVDGMVREREKGGTCSYLVTYYSRKEPPFASAVAKMVATARERVQEMEREEKEQKRQRERERERAHMAWIQRVYPPYQKDALRSRAENLEEFAKLDLIEQMEKLRPDQPTFYFNKQFPAVLVQDAITESDVWRQQKHLTRTKPGQGLGKTYRNSQAKIVWDRIDHAQIYGNKVRMHEVWDPEMMPAIWGG